MWQHISATNPLDCLCASVRKRGPMRRGMITAFLLLALPSIATARGGPPHCPTSAKRADPCKSVARLAANPKDARCVCQQFMRQSGFPQGRAGYRVELLKAVDAGGSVSADNLIWRPVRFADQQSH
jgi:hypothetical protein